MAASVFFAIREAVKCARHDNGKTGYFEFWCPATPERIKMACCDQFTEKVRLYFIEMIITIS